MTRRQPWPWEEQLPEVETVPVDYRGIVLLPPVRAPGGAWVSGGGEVAPGIRDTRDKLARDWLSLTDGSEGAREWADSKAALAARNYDAGVRAGDIIPPR